MVAVAGEASEIVLSGQGLREVAYLHLLTDAHQVKHILGAAAHAARAAELMAAMTGISVLVTLSALAAARHKPSWTYSGATPAPPPGGGRAGELLRELDEALRDRF
jgi:hypothetical protein